MTLDWRKRRAKTLYEAGAGPSPHQAEVARSYEIRRGKVCRKKTKRGNIYPTEVAAQNAAEKMGMKLATNTIKAFHCPICH